jgi:hypothetical protein
LFYKSETEYDARKHTKRVNIIATALASSGLQSELRREVNEKEVLLDAFDRTRTDNLQKLENKT